MIIGFMNLLERDSFLADLGGLLREAAGHGHCCS